MSETVHNERVKLAATALNNLAVGAVLAGIVSPLVTGSVGDFIHVASWIALGADLFALAHVTLGRLA